MSIASEISRISGNVSDALDAIEAKGVTIPSGANSDDLATLIGQISGGGTGAISVVDTTDTAGGIIRTITAVDISDTTAVASDVAHGKYFYTAAGVKTAGTASGGSSYTLLTSAEFTVSTTSTSEITVGTIAAGASAYTGDKILVVSIRDKAGQRAGYYYGSDSFFANTYAKNGSTNTCNMVAQIFCYTGTNGRMMGGSGPWGVFAKSVTSSGVITINARYSSINQSIDGTFKCDVYLLDWPGGLTPYVPPLEV